MFKTYVVAAGLILTLGVALLILPCYEKDRMAYQKLSESSRPLQQDDVLSYSQQTRGEVRKRVWYQDKTPLHIRIDSDESELFFFRQHGKIEVVEQLGNVICIMQEELYYVEGKPMQKVRYMEAENATYNYSTHQFIAQDVKIWKYQLEGHAPPEHFQGHSPLMSATANGVEFTLKGGKLDFIAHQMRATVNSKERAL